MENLPRSRSLNKRYHATIAERACNDSKFVGKTMYDDVFGGPPKFGVPNLSPRPEDYSEIFCGFHASRATSIPVLDLPVVDEEEVFFDVRSCGFDYREVFGGLDCLDFATSYEELLRQFNGGGRRDREGDLNLKVDLSEETWIPAETESLSGDSDHSGNNQFSSNGDPYEPIDSSMEFSISYQRSNRDLSNGIARISQPCAPNHTCVLDETMPLKKTEHKNPPVHIHDDGQGKHLRKTLSHPAKRNAGQRTFTNNLESNRNFEKVGLLSDEMFVTISEISLKTQPSEVPPPSRTPPILDSKSKGYEDSQTTAPGGTIGNNSPPYFDVEIDASSAAAASVAAMKEAMEKAQVKLKSAKEQMDRKRGVQNSMEPSSKHDAKDKKEKLSDVDDGSSNVKNKRVQGTRKVEDSGLKPSIGQEKKEGMKNTQAVSNPLEKDRAFNMAKMSADEKLGKESLSSQGSDKIDVADEWQEATQFFELVRTDKSKMAFVEASNCSVPVEKTKRNDHQLKEEKVATEALKQQEDSHCKANAIREDHEVEKVFKNLKTAKETCERGGSTARSEAAKGAYRHKGHEKKGKVAHVVIKLEENVVKSRMVWPLENGKTTGVEESQKYEKQVNGQVNEIRFEVQQAVKHKEDEQLRKETSKSMEYQKSSQCQETNDGEKRQSEVFVLDENDIRLGQAHEQAENEKMMEGAHQQEENEDESLKQTCELVENGKKEKEADELDEGEMIWRKALEQLENEKRLKQALEQEETQKERETYPEEENEKRSKQVLEQENNEKQKMVYEREAIENRLEQDHHEKDKTEKPLEEAFELEDNSRTLKEAWDGEDEMKRKLTLEQEEYELTGVNEVHLQTEKVNMGEKVQIDEGAHQHMGGEDLTASDGVGKLDSHAKAGLGIGPDKKCDEQEKPQKSVLVEDSGKMRSEYRDCEKRSEATEEENLDRKYGFSGMDQDELEHAASQLRMGVVSSTYHQDDSVKKACEAGIVIGLRNAEKIKCVLSMDSNNEKQGRKPAYEWREIGKSINEAKTALNQEEDKDKFVPTPMVKESAETGRKTAAAQSSVPAVKGDTLRTAQPANISEDAERKEKNVNESLTFKEKGTERMKREIELERERLRKIEEEREREREREKDRMAVDRVTLEACERAYAEGRERAERAALERATPEARQRAMAEARERLEKASAEAREKSSTEARLRAERAAVERATAEARERAVEKAMAERAAFEARERAERSMSDKFSTFSRNTRMRTCSSSSDLQNQKFQNTGSFSGSRYSSDYNGLEGESAQRCKARLERYQRTAERAAKALAEKNMRDHIAQREQAERIRLAETLDADVKRWSSGKEGNLRALLSTLQYILGPDSGWQPIPLTEVITSAAVKKAYRKATLCVHPDKLQQRAASIQQKYICEKVFDLLKEAWNKFNSEER